MKEILCYGDSNTYGYDPYTTKRYDTDTRWTALLQKMLGEEYHIIEEGCNGRTTVIDDPKEAWKNGRTYLKACLNSHKPLDYVILMLGTNDLKTIYRRSAEMIAEGAGILVDDMIAFTKEKQGYVPKIMLVSPIEVNAKLSKSSFYGRFDETAVQRSEQFATLYRAEAFRRNIYFLNAAEVASACDHDCIHLDETGHKRLAEAMAEKVKEMEYGV